LTSLSYNILHSLNQFLMYVNSSVALSRFGREWSRLHTDYHR